VAVAVAAWLAELSWPAVVGVMALALAIAWLVEWVSWREGQASAVAPRLDHRPVVAGTLPEPRPKLESEPEPEPEPEPESVVEPEPPPAAETVSEPVAVEADPEPVPPSAEEPETAAPTVPEPVETAPEAGPAESGEEMGEAPVREPVHARAPKARRSWHGRSLRRVDPPEATTPGEPTAPAESEPAKGVEPAPAARKLEPPVEVESRPEPQPEPEPRPGYPPPQEVQPSQTREVTPVVPPAPTNVVRMPPSAEPRAWNVWELESLAREQARLEPERGEEWSYLFVHLRQFADAKGKLPSEFDGLVRESFGELLETLEPA
jgi:hypothetical protein